jgi:hypothetical protein
LSKKKMMPTAKNLFQAVFKAIQVGLVLTITCSLLTSCAIFGPSAASPETKLAPALLKEDLSLLKRILEANHPSLYWYGSKEKLDSQYQLAYSAITDSMYLVAYKNLLAQWVAQIQCGHTRVLFPKASSRNTDRFRYPAFPLTLKVWNDTAVVTGNYDRNDSVLRRGTQIMSINHRSIASITATMYAYMSTDGMSINHKAQNISSNFPAWYRTVFGTDTMYHFVYKTKEGRLDTALRKAFTPVRVVSPARTDSSRNAGPELSKRQIRLLSKRILMVDTVNRFAVMRLNTFSSGAMKQFFRSSFRSLKKLGIKDLAIDLRENGGGRVNNYIRLTRYLAKQPFKVGDTVAAVTRNIRYKRYIKPAWPFWIAMQLRAKKMDDGKFHYRRYEQHYFQPYDSNKAYSGSLYLIQAGATFSAASMFTATLKGQSNVLIVGEESGGGYYGNSAMHIPEIVLPNSKLRVTLPLYRLVMDKNRPKGRGVLPDIEVPPNAAMIAKSVDPKLLYISNLIAARKQAAVKE